jgi:hypothetical protein
MYIRAVAQLDWLLGPLEEALQKTENLVSINVDYVRLLPLSRQPSNDEILAGLVALHSLGVLKDCGSLWRLDRVSLNETAGYRRGIRDTIRYLPSSGQNTVKICAALPTGLPHRVEHTIRNIAGDLRAALLDIIATAQERIVLASPFWDAETATELVALLGACPRISVISSLNPGLACQLRAQMGHDL